MVKVYATRARWSGGQRQRDYFWGILQGGDETIQLAVDVATTTQEGVTERDDNEITPGLRFSKA